MNTKTTKKTKTTKPTKSKEKNFTVIQETTEFPVLPLRDVVVYPHMVIPLFVGREKSVLALEASMLADKKILLVAQRNPADDVPEKDGLYDVGTVATILQLLKLPDGTVKVLVEGLQRVSLQEVIDNKKFLKSLVTPLMESKKHDREIEIFTRSLLSQFEQYVKLNKKIPPEILSSLAAIEDVSRLTDTIAAHLSLKVTEKQEVLEEINLKKRLEKLMTFIETEIDLLQIEKRIRGRVKRQMEKSQREYYLNEQMKAIQKELGDISEEPNEMEELEARINSAGMPKVVREKCLAELKKFKLMPGMSAEATVIRNYLDWILNVPWKKRTKIRFDLNEAEDILEHDHYGLKKVKERIIEYLAVQQRVKKLKGPILCLVGPPGVGKTSLGHSIAHATGREFIRIALGGVRDEAEIRGHRKTYIGSMPGNIIQKLAKVGVKNPLLMLDEVDKMAMDFRGDPAAALLEVLDPEQNHIFNDHYLEVDYDLSEVMFIATANTLDIPPALVDRMEIIRLPGYTEEEKIHIATRHLMPKQLKINGLTDKEIKMSIGSIREIIRYYTREAGVRNLEREIAKVSRRVVKEIITGKATSNPTHVSQKNSEKYLGIRKYRYGLAECYDQVGQVNGLAWTEVGGELLKIEAATMPGRGKAMYTGHLGDVMQESIQAAMTVVRTRAKELGIDPNFHEKLDIHVHVPEGATPKDGPSAGIGMCIALVSVLTNIPVRADVAMTGEITLRGDLLPIGGLKEKLIAALRGRIKRVIIPEDNKRDLSEISSTILKGLEIIPVKWVKDVFDLVLTEQVYKRGKKGVKASKTKKSVKKSTTKKSTKKPVKAKKRVSKSTTKKSTKKPIKAKKQVKKPTTKTKKTTKKSPKKTKKTKK